VKRSKRQYLKLIRKVGKLKKILVTYREWNTLSLTAFFVQGSIPKYCGVAIEVED